MHGRPIVIEGTREDEDRGLFYLPWADLRRWLWKKCASANRNLWIKRLDPAFTLTYQRLDNTELKLLYCCKTGEYTMRLSYYHPMRGFIYRMDDEPFILDLHVTDPYGNKPFETRNHQSLTVAQAGRLVLSVLLNASNATTARIC
jgi:hypothetical protein